MAAKFDIDALIEEQVEELDSAIEEVEKRMRPYEKLNQKKQQLLAARKALRGQGSRLTGGTSTRLTGDELKGYFKENPGSTPDEAAQRFGVSGSTIRSSLYRNKSQYVTRDSRYWVRDPKNGLNTADDIPEDEDDD